jgi:hypothetical protein
MMMDTDFPAITPGKQFLLSFLPQVPVTEKPEGYYRENLEGSRSAFVTGTGMEPVGAAQQYRQREGGPIFSETVIAGSPSFDLNMPKTPMGQSFEGIPNASPEMLRKLMERKLKNPGGQELPGFIRKV